METLYIPTENDFRRWIKEAVVESLQEMVNKQTNASTIEEPLLSRKQVAKKLNIP